MRLPTFAFFAKEPALSPAEGWDSQKPHLSPEAWPVILCLTTQLCPPRHKPQSRVLLSGEDGQMNTELNSRSPHDQR